jgi:hypothetical protein
VENVADMHGWSASDMVTEVRGGPPCLCDESFLRAPAGAAAAHASVAASIPGHDGAADGADGRVAHVNQVL